MFDLEYLIRTYGYWALFAGTFLEGETVLIMAGFAARLGYLELSWVMVVALLGSFAGDQFYFLIGRTKGKTLLSKRRGWQKKVDRVYKLLERYHTAFLISFRFMTGLRTVTPIVIGMTPMRFSRFLILNLIGAVLWSVIFGAVGYLFGNVLETIIRDIRRYEHIALFAIAIVCLIPWIIYWHRKKRQNSS